MNYANLTDDQVRQLSAAVVPLHNVMKEEALLKVLDMVVGFANAGSTDAVTALAEDINTWSGALATKLNADATAQNALADFPLTMDTDYAGTDL